MAYLQPKPKAPFQNLDFESANVAGYSPGSSDVPITSALPGWIGYYASSTSTNVAAQVWYDGISLGGAVISVIDSLSGERPLQGTYSVALFGGGSLIGEFTSSTISQTGLVPAGTKSLLLDGYGGSMPFVVTLGGQTINMTALQTFSNYTVYGGNIPSALAGQSETLSLTEPAPPQNPPSFFELDNIQFSNLPTPEPGVLGLWALGALILGWRT